MTVPHHVRPPHHELPRGNRYDNVGHDAPFASEPRKSTAPPGLWAPAPEVVAEKVVKPRVRTKRASRAKPNAGQAREVALLPCGTNAAYRRHLTRREQACDECKAARADYNRSRKREWRTNPVQVREGCGTEAGLAEHSRRKERMCDQCRTVAVAPKPKLPPTVGPKCGTTAGRSWHRRRNQEPCVPCKDAVNEAARKTFNEGMAA